MCKREAADVKERFPAMMKKTQQRERHLDSNVTTRDAESEVGADLEHGHRVTPCSPLFPPAPHAPCYAMKGVIHPQVEVLVDNEFEAEHQVICPLLVRLKRKNTVDTQPRLPPHPPPPTSLFLAAVVYCCTLFETVLYF